MLPIGGGIHPYGEVPPVPSRGMGYTSSALVASTMVWGATHPVELLRWYPLTTWWWRAGINTMTQSTYPH